MPHRGDHAWDAFAKGDSKKGYSSKFSHDNESATPGYYSVKLDDAGMLVELTATEHCGMHRYTPTENGAWNLMIDWIIHLTKVAHTGFVNHGCSITCN
jgi:putative alpha-1,2-mannosidase